MNYNDISAMLAAGKTADEIAKEFTDALNKASAEQKAKEEAKAKEDAKSKKKDEIAVAIAHAMNEYIAISGIDAEKLRGAEVRELLDQILPVIDSFKNIKVHVSKNAPKAKKSAEDIFDWFFKEMNFLITRGSSLTF